MATLEKIRNKAGLLVIVVGVALFAFIIGDFLNSGSTFFRQSHEKVGEVNGEVITVQDYQGRLDEMIEMYKMQTNSNTVPEEYMANIRQSVFDTMVQEIVLNEAADKLGMVVGSDELFDMVQGENISPMIQQMPMFMNPQTGMFDKAALLQFLKTINSDLRGFSPQQQEELIQAKNFWLFWEKNIKRQRLEQKYTTLLSKAVSVNVLDAKADFEEGAESSDIAYVMQSYSSIPDSTIKVSDSEIEKLYKQRKESYKQKEARNIKYIAVDIAPSPEDYKKISDEIEGLKEEFVSSNNVAELVNEYSDVPYLDAFFSIDALDPEMKQFVGYAEVGDVHGPVFEDDKYRMFKLVSRTYAADSVRVAHIMLADDAKVDSLLTELRQGAEFGTLANDNSLDQSSLGGELGWFTEIAALRNLGEEFRNVMFSTPVNQVVVVKSNWGTHLVKVLEKTSNVTKYKIADIEMEVSPSSRTYSNLYNELNQFVSKNQNVKDLTENAREAGYNALTTSVTATDNVVGTVRNSRPVIRWAFQNKKGAVSEIFECDDKFVVAAVDGVVKEGYRSLASVTPSLRSELMGQKKGEQIEKQLKDKNLRSLNAYAQEMSATVDTVKFVSFSTRRITGIGIEPKLNAAVDMTAVGQVSAPVAGTNGVYVFEVIEKHKDMPEYKEEEQIASLNLSNSYRFGYQAIQELINQSDVKDTRIRFY